MPIFDFLKGSGWKERDEGKLKAFPGAAHIAALRAADGERRTAAAEALAALGPPAVPALVVALRDPDAGVRAGAAYALGKIGDARAVEPIMALVEDRDPSLRSVAARALGRLRDSRAVTALTRALEDGHVNVRLQAAGSLREIGGPSAVSPLIEALEDPDARVRLQAALALSTLGDGRAVEPLIQRLRSRGEHYDVQMVAILGLGELGDHRALGVLLGALGADDAQARAAGAEALGKIGLPPAMTGLIRALADEQPLVRRNAVAALGAIGDARARVSVEHTLHDPDAAVRVAAREALERIPKPPEPAVAPGERPKHVGDVRKGDQSYRQYVAGDAGSARAFLAKRKPDYELEYITVETPEGIWGKDIEGLYLVRLLLWQRDLRLADCQGTIVIDREREGDFRFNLVAQEDIDNVLVELRCGQCGASWSDGVDYQGETVVRCPECRTYNLVSMTITAVCQECGCEWRLGSGDYGGACPRCRENRGVKQALETGRRLKVEFSGRSQSQGQRLQERGNLGGKRP
jgi:HEAT repeat protein